MKSDKVIHPIPAVYNENSKILILGSFPSVKSREYGFFYGHPQNRFWCVIAAVFGEKVPHTIEEKKALLYSCRIALWDVIAECEITGSSDSSIKQVKVNDISMILNAAKIEKIFTNGKKAQFLYEKYIFPYTKIKSTVLPSTSPANAAKSREDLINEWSQAING